MFPFIEQNNRLLSEFELKFYFSTFLYKKILILLNQWTSINSDFSRFSMIPSYICKTSFITSCQTASFPNFCLLSNYSKINSWTVFSIFFNFEDYLTFFSIYWFPWYKTLPPIVCCLIPKRSYSLNSLSLNFIIWCLRWLKVPKYLTIFIHIKIS